MVLHRDESGPAVAVGRGSRDALICSMMLLRDRPDPPGPSCILWCPLVASTMSSRRVYLLLARPTSSSELPYPYTLAVS